jgi:hypothetical protein
MLMESDEPSQGPKKPANSGAATEKKKRLGDALRRNLAKRKGGTPGKNQVDKAC